MNLNKIWTELSDKVAMQFIAEGFILKTEEQDYFIVGSKGKLKVEKIDGVPEIGGHQNHISNIRIDLRGQLREFKLPVRIPIGNMGLLCGWSATLVISKDATFKMEDFTVS